VKRIAFFGVFVVAIWSLSTGWAALRTAWETPTLTGLIQTVGYAAVFAAAFLYLGISVYTWDRAAGRVRRRITLYEWWLRGKSQ
jgi:hypothetical protein